MADGTSHYAEKVGDTQRLHYLVGSEKFPGADAGWNYHSNA